MCDRWSFWSEIEGGTTTDTLIEARQIAIQHLTDNPDLTEIDIYTSRTKKNLVGTVKNTGRMPMFEWQPKKGRILPLKADGQTRHRYQ